MTRTEGPSTQLENPVYGDREATSKLDALVFHVGPGAYDFCVHDFKLLDAQGTEVRP